MTDSSTTASKRTQNAAARRKAIVDAALAEFLEKGFSSTRMDDIAVRAGVAKGTIYLYFADKEALFEGIIQQEIEPQIALLPRALDSSVTLESLLEGALLPSVTDLIHSRKAAVVRLLIAEGGRFPKLAEVYYRVVIEPGLTTLSALMRTLAQRGELRDGRIADFPQMLVAPALMAVIWGGLFEGFRHLEVEEMLRTFVGLLSTEPAPKSKPASRAKTKRSAR